jgi:hypothetical protein
MPSHPARPQPPPQRRRPPPTRRPDALNTCACPGGHRPSPLGDSALRRAVVTVLRQGCDRGRVAGHPKWPGRPGGDALGPVALVAALGHVPGDLVAVLGERLTNASATPTTAHYRPRPRARRAGCRSPTTGPSPERAGGRPSWPPPNNSRSAAESRPPLNHPWRRASHSSSSPGCDRAGPDHPPERWRDGYGRRQRPGRGPAPGSAPLAATDLELAVEPLHRGVGVGVITAVVMTTRGPRGSPT